MYYISIIIHYYHKKMNNEFGQRLISEISRAIELHSTIKEEDKSYIKEVCSQLADMFQLSICYASHRNFGANMYPTLYDLFCKCKKLIVTGEKICLTNISKFIPYHPSVEMLIDNGKVGLFLEEYPRNGELSKFDKINYSSVVCDKIRDPNKNRVKTEVDKTLELLSDDDYIRVIFSCATNVLDTVDPFLIRMGLLMPVSKQDF